MNSQKLGDEDRGGGAAALCASRHSPGVPRPGSLRDDVQHTLGPFSRCHGADRRAIEVYEERDEAGCSPLSRLGRFEDAYVGDERAEPSGPESLPLSMIMYPEELDIRARHLLTLELPGLEASVDSFSSYAGTLADLQFRLRQIHDAQTTRVALIYAHRATDVRGIGRAQDDSAIDQEVEDAKAATKDIESLCDEIDRTWDMYEDRARFRDPLGECGLPSAMLAVRAKMLQARVKPDPDRRKVSAICGLEEPR